MVPLYSLSIEHVSFNLNDLSILSVNCSHLCIIYVKIYEEISSGGLAVSFTIACYFIL